MSEGDFILKGKAFLFSQKYEEAFEQFSKYGTQIHSKSNYYLGIMYKEGKFVDKNDQAAAALFYFGCMLSNEKLRRSEMIDLENQKCALELFYYFKEKVSRYKYKDLIEPGINFIFNKEREKVYPHKDICLRQSESYKLIKERSKIVRKEEKNWIRNEADSDNILLWYCINRCQELPEGKYHLACLTYEKGSSTSTIKSRLGMINVVCRYLIDAYKEGYLPALEKINQIIEDHEKIIKNIKINKIKNYYIQPISSDLIKYIISNFNNRIPKGCKKISLNYGKIISKFFSEEILEDMINHKYIKSEKIEPVVSDILEEIQKQINDNGYNLNTNILDKTSLTKMFTKSFFYLETIFSGDIDDDSFRRKNKSNKSNKFRHENERIVINRLDNEIIDEQKIITEINKYKKLYGIE